MVGIWQLNMGMSFTAEFWGGVLLKSEERRPFISQDYWVDSSQSQDRKVNLIKRKNDQRMFWEPKLINCSSENQ